MTANQTHCFDRPLLCHLFFFFAVSVRELQVHHPFLSQPPGLALGLQQGEDVAFADGPLDVPDDLSVLFTEELHLDLGTLTLGAGTSQNLEIEEKNC